MVARRRAQEAELEAHWDVLRAMAPRAARLERAQACALVPVLRPRTACCGAVYEPDAADMDVHAIHQGYLRGMRQRRRQRGRAMPT